MYLFSYWFSAGVICGISPPAVAAIPSLDGLIFVCCKFRNWTSKEVVEFSNNSILGGCCAEWSLLFCVKLSDFVQS